MPDPIIEAIFMSFFIIGVFFTVLFTVLLLAEDWR